MAIVKEIILDKAEVVALGHIQVREKIVIKEDDIVLASNYHRKVLHPGQDVSGEAEMVRNIAAAIWTPEVIAEYLASVGE